MTGARHLADLIRDQSASGLPAIVLPGLVEPEVVPWRDVAAEAETMALALLQMGLEAREAIAFVVRRPELALSALFGTWLAGGIATYLDPDDSPEALKAYLTHAECRFAFVDGAGNHALTDLACLDNIVDLDADREAFLEAGRERADLLRNRAGRRFAELEPGDVACYAYCSGGTLAAPLAAMLTHAGLLAAGAALSRALGLVQGDRIRSLLPQRHCVGRAFEIAACLAGAALCGTAAGNERHDAPGPDSGHGHARGQGSEHGQARGQGSEHGHDEAGFECLDAPAPGDRSMLQTCPTILAGPYTAAETLARQVLHAADRANPLQQRTWHWALDTGMAEYRRKMLLGNAGTLTGWRGRLAQRLGLDGALDPYGGALRLVACTGGTLSAFAHDLLGALGVGAMGLYVLTEAGGAAAASDPRHPGKAGDVGIALESSAVQVADDCEILVRGPALFAGYLKEPGITGRALLGGWFRTGDRGERDGRHLRLLGPVEAERGFMVRVTALDVEASLRCQPAIADAIAVPGMPWVALVIPAAEVLADVATRSGIALADALGDPRIETAIEQAITAYNAAAEFEGRVSAYAIVPSLPHRTLGTLDRKAATCQYEALLDAPIPVPLPDML